MNTAQAESMHDIGSYLARLVDKAPAGGLFHDAAVGIVNAANHYASFSVTVGATTYHVGIERTQ